MRCRTLAPVAVWIASVACAFAVGAHDEPIEIGASTSFHSEILGEDRSILISTPVGYEDSRDRHPVLYVLDGNAFFLQAVADARFLSDRGMAPAMIVVGVPSGASRVRDLTPPTTTPSDLEEAPTAGGADRFRRFLADELQPFVEQRYRTEPYRILVGWSFGGLFAIHTLLEEPGSFDAYIAISPSLWWNSEAETAATERLFASGAELKKFLYLTHGREYNDIPRSVQGLTRVLGRKAPAGLRWTFAYLPNDNHSSSPRRGIYDALEHLFEGWGLPEDAGFPTPSELEKRYATLTERFGFVCRPAEGRINGMAYALLQQQRTVEATALFEYLVRTFPGSPNAYDSVADAYEVAGKLDLALANARSAVRLAEEQSDRRLPIFAAHLERLRAATGGGAVE